MKTQTLRTAQDVRVEFRRKGRSITSWAKANGFSPATVSQVLSGKNAATLGTGHRIAVMMGIKDGEILEGKSHE